MPDFIQNGCCNECLLLGPQHHDNACSTVPAVSYKHAKPSACVTGTSVNFCYLHLPLLHAVAWHTVLLPATLPASAAITLHMLLTLNTAKPGYLPLCMLPFDHSMLQLARPPCYPCKAIHWLTGHPRAHAHASVPLTPSHLAHRRLHTSAGQRLPDLHRGWAIPWPYATITTSTPPPAPSVGVPPQ